MTSGWTRRTASALVAAVLGMLLCMLSAGPVGVGPAGAVPLPTGAPPAFSTPVTDHCPHKIGTPPPVDESEAVAPGSTTPSSLPVPTPAIGGEDLSYCGVVADPAAGPVPPRLTSAGWLIADLDSGRVIAAKDPHGRYRPASTIKVLLALIALDELDLDATVIPTAEDWSTEGDSCGMGPGGHYTVRDLLTGLLMVSGNDCANALARELGGVETTLEKMNERARELGAADTRAASPSGLDAAGMSSSPYDLALIFRAAMAQKTFRELIAKPTFRFPGYPRRPDVPGDKDHPAYDMYSSNRLLVDGYPGMLGGKTGYTDDARKTFVGVAERDGHRILVVQMYGLSVEGDMYWDQARAMFEYGFRAGPEVTVGRLVDSTREAAESTAPHAASSPDSHLASSGSDTASPMSVRVLIGLVAALAAVVLLLLGLRLFGRR
ncbi:D-alanyl-D-alanine carboxypeptidase [Gordonia amicalis]|uniref:D-alanyl-D-alanine carboxypeptidase family protein n=1 Tax=Gordonia amicalis TaxID=89053 RepID=A0AAE4U707_9ACTN|nr:MULTISPECIES: D-alanyl-D-alanine carboxypeptidase family protein [Gordonia]MCZ4578076.1 D-alanyl-D-alanine carboxypeptidase [Gordonia amicalis]MDV6310876.1 D-alanyl-D-alanine carboxypeptidase family protein [Gordonia amicalis]UPW13922.1 D-alanyl-D-alanine carboxypeptidase [Gordonia amicalis]